MTVMSMHKCFFIRSTEVQKMEGGYFLPNISIQKTSFTLGLYFQYELGAQKSPFN